MKNTGNNAVKPITYSEFEFINGKYKFELMGDYVVVHTMDSTRATLHRKDKSFILNTALRKLTISKRAMALWEEYFNPEFTLLEVQYAINSLVVTYQDVTVDDVLNILERGNTKVLKSNESDYNEIKGE